MTPKDRNRVWNLFIIAYFMGGVAMAFIIESRSRTHKRWPEVLVLVVMAILLNVVFAFGIRWRSK